MKRLSFLTEAYIIFVAICLDVLQMLLVLILAGIVVDTIISVLYFAFVGIVFYVNSVPLVNPRTSKKMVLSALGELIPGLNALPWLTIGTILILRDIRVEDTQSAATAQDDEEGETEEESPAIIDIEAEEYVPETDDNQDEQQAA